MARGTVTTEKKGTSEDIFFSWVPVSGYRGNARREKISKDAYSDIHSFSPREGTDMRGRTTVWRKVPPGMSAP